jgi:hypothetical protein
VLGGGVLGHAAPYEGAHWPCTPAEPLGA